MRCRARGSVLALLLVWSAGAFARQTPADEVDALLAKLEAALESATVAPFLNDYAPALTAHERQWLLDLVPAGEPHAITIRPQARSNDTLTADVLITRGDRATLASWHLTVAPDASSRLTLTSIHETSRLDDLVRLELDSTRQFAVSDLVVDGRDFRLSLPSGTAFASMVDGAIAALVLQGRSTVHFAPPDPTEQGQLRIFAGAAALHTTVDSAFIRVNPADAGATLRGTLREQTRIGTGALARARRIFDERTRAHDLDIGGLSDVRWGPNASRGSLFVAFQTRRAGWLTYTQSPDLAEDVSLVEPARRRQISLYSSRAAHGIQLLMAGTEAPYRTTHTDLDVVFDPDRLWLRGRASLHLRIDAPTRGLMLQLATPLRVLSVSSPELGPLLAVRSSTESRMLVGLPRVLRPAETLTIDVQFQGALDPQRLDDDMPQFRRLPDAQDALGVTPRYLYSNGAPWYPQIARNPHATATLRITVPAPFDVVASGRRGDTVFSPFADDPEGSARQARTVTFTADRPVRYLAFLVARMESIGRQPPATEGSVDVEVFAPPGSAAARRATAPRARDILAFYTQTLGEAPYASLTVAALDDQLPSGHSPAHAALINVPLPSTPYAWDRDPVAFDDVPDFFLAHELAHQWWGQAVAGRDYREQWISEGFAQYLAWMYVASVHGTATAERLMARMRASAAGLDAEGPIRLGFRLGHLRGDRRVYRAIVYNKAAVVLHMLRRLIGDEAFISGLRQILDVHRFSAITTTDVERAFQAHTDLPLQRFFTRWIREAGTPALRAGWSVDATGALVIDVEQRGVVFDLPYTAIVHFRNGARQTVPLAITDATLRLVVPVTGVVRRVEFGDPMTPARLVR